MGTLTVYTDRNALPCCQAEPAIGGKSVFYGTGDVIAAARCARLMDYDVLFLGRTEFELPRERTRFPVLDGQKRELMHGIFGPA